MLGWRGPSDSTEHGSATGPESDSHIVIDAGAGTGKTSTIVDRVIEHYLASDQRATRILPKPARAPSIGGGW